MNFQTLVGGMQEGYCILKSVELKTTAKGMKYLDLMLADKTGDINAKYWNCSDLEATVYKSGDIVKVRGTTEQYKGTDQFKIDKIRTVNESDGVNPDDFVPSAEYSAEQMYSALIDIASAFEDDELKRITLAIYEEYKETILFSPAAFKLHHAIRGGLLYHTLSIVRLAEGVAKVYPFVDRELLIAGAMLHDIAKIHEFSLNKSGLVEEYSASGNLLGHIPMGAMIIDRKAEQLGISDETKMLLEHMVLSHHGNPEFGAAVYPMFLEAELLSELDLMDARVYEIREATSAVGVGKFTAKQWALDNVKLYNHGRGTDSGAKLL